MLNLMSMISLWLSSVIQAVMTTLSGTPLLQVHKTWIQGPPPLGSEVETLSMWKHPPCMLSLSVGSFLMTI